MAGRAHLALFCSQIFVHMSNITNVTFALKFENLEAFMMKGHTIFEIRRKNALDLRIYRKLKQRLTDLLISSVKRVEVLSIQYNLK